MRRRTVVAAVVCTVIMASASVASQASTSTTLFFHTGHRAANADQALKTANVDGGPFMDTTAPSGSTPAAAEFTVGNGDIYRGPYQPAWAGRFGGVIQSAQVTFWASSVASDALRVSLYADGASTPFAEKVVTPGPQDTQFTVDFTGLNQTVVDLLLVQINTHNSATATRADATILFDSTDYPSAITLVADPLPAVGVTPPNFANYPAPASFVFAHGPNETAIGVNEQTGNVLFQMAGDTARVHWDDSVSPPRAIWEDASLHAHWVGLDPMLYTDRTLGRTIVTQLLGPGSSEAFTDDDGANWTVGQPPISGPSYDHPTVGSGPYAEPKPLTARFEHAFYYCAQGGVTAQCTRSDDGGMTWGAPIPIEVLDCVGIHGHIVVGSDGTPYVPNRSCGATQGLFFGVDNGLSWGVRHVPGTEPTDSDPAIAIDRADRLYFATTSGGKAVVSTTTDHGVTFSTPVDVSSALGIANAVFPAAVAGYAGRAAVMFYGTTTPGNFRADAFTGAWHIYVAMTIDAGATWTTVDATPNDPVQRGLICVRGLSCSTGRNLLDFQSITVDTEGRVIVGYADGCTSEMCITADGKNNVDSGSMDSLGTIARQTSGPRLF